MGLGLPGLGDEARPEGAVVRMRPPRWIVVVRDHTEQLEQKMGARALAKWALGEEEG